MKKIVALVLGLALAMALTTTAFAGTVLSGNYFVLNTSDTTSAKTTVTDLTFNTAKAPTINSDGDYDQTALPNVAYYSWSGDTVKGVQVASQADADYVIYGADAKSVVMYLAAVANPQYVGVGTVYSNFGTKCGQVNMTVADKTTYYTANDGTKNIYKSDKNGTINLMVGNALVKVSATGYTTANVVAHTFIPVVVDGKVTGYKCSSCNMAATKAANFSLLPKEVKTSGNYLGPETDGSYWYFTSTGTAAAATGKTGAGVTSAKTFDAGIAMYAGLALMSVAGTAVVIGKKKD